MSLKITMADFVNGKYEHLTQEQKDAGRRLFARYLSYCKTGLAPPIYSKACADYLSSGKTSTIASTSATTIVNPTQATASSFVTSATTATAAFARATAAIVQPTAATTVAANFVGSNFTTTAYASGGSGGVGGGPASAVTGIGNLDCLHSINACIDSQLRAVAGATTVAPELLTAQPADAGVLCYDAYMCSSERTAAMGHQLLGPFGLVLCLAALFSQLVFLALFRFRSVKSPTSLYLSAMCLFDAAACLLLGLLPVTQFLPGDAVVQRQVYHSFTVYLAPIGQPLLEWADLVSLYLLIVLFVQHRCGLHKVKFVAPTVISLAVALLLYSLPKMCRYWFHTDSLGRRALRLTRMGADATYQKIEDQLLKVPVELFIPYLTIGGFTCFRLYKRLDKHLVSKNTQKREALRPAPDAAPSARRQRASSSISTDRKLDRKQQQEAVNADIVAIVGAIVFACRFPNLVFHIVRSHGPAVKTHLELTFYVVSNFLFVLSLLLKPAAYIARGAQYRRLIRLFMVSVCGNGGGGGSSSGATGTGSGHTINRSRNDGLDGKSPCGGSSIPMNDLSGPEGDSSQRCERLTNVDTQQTLLCASQSVVAMQSDVDESRLNLLASQRVHRDNQQPSVFSLPPDESQSSHSQSQTASQKLDNDNDDELDGEDKVSEVNDARYHQLNHHQHPGRQPHHQRREHNSASVSSDNAAFVALDESAC